MPAITIDQAIQAARRHHQAGQLGEAEKLYRQILSQHPNQIDALHLLGVLSVQTGRMDEGVELMKQAIRLKPGYAEVHNNLGNALKAMGQLDQAIASYRQAIALKTDYAEAQYGLGIAFEENGELDEAIAAYRQAIRIKPDYAAAHNNLGKALKDKGQVNEAVDSYRNAIRLKPDYFPAHNNLGNALNELGKSDEAIASFRQALRLKPDVPIIHVNLGVALQGQGQFDEAIACYQQAIRLQPDLAEAHSNLGNVLSEKYQPDEAIASYREAIRLRPDFAGAHNNLGLMLAEQGKLDEAIAECRLTIQLKPKNSDSYTNLLYALYHHPKCDSPQLLNETRQWARRHGLRATVDSPTRDRSPNRRLKIGYLSPFFNMCADAHFIFPLLANHDQKQFEIFCFNRTAKDDEITDRFRGLGNRWIDIRRLSDEASAEMIRRCEIDILVNISRPADECLLIMANRLAPIQMNWITFASCTSGLEEMDYRISDAYLDPVGIDELCYSEKTLRLPQTAWCYDPLINSPPVNPLPALTAGFITFGSLNRLSKINSGVVTAWAEILRSVPGSRLHLLAVPGSHRQRLLDEFRELNVAPERIEFIDRLPRFDYLKQYERIDISLDPFPFCGHTTTFDSLWMGVPVVTLLGSTSVGRVSSSALHNLDMAEFIGKTAKQYVSLALQLSADIPKLAGLRAALRQRMLASPIMDAPRFAHNIEAAYRQAWRNWCEYGPSQAYDQNPQTKV